MPYMMKSGHFMRNKKRKKLYSKQETYVNQFIETLEKVKHTSQNSCSNMDWYIIKYKNTEQKIEEGNCLFLFKQLISTIKK